jgi:hypothetical protein
LANLQKGKLEDADMAKMKEVALQLAKNY